MRRGRAVRRRPFELSHVRQGIRPPRAGASARSRPAAWGADGGEAERQDAGPGSSERSMGFTTSSPAARDRGERSPSASRVSRMPRSIAARVSRAARRPASTAWREPLVDLLADIVHRVHDGIAHLPEGVLGVAAQAESALADAGARLTPGPGRHEQRDAGAEQRTEEEGRHTAGAALHHDPGEVLVLGHDSSFAVVVRRRPVRACAAQRGAGSAT